MKSLINTSFYHNNGDYASLSIVETPAGCISTESAASHGYGELPTVKVLKDREEAVTTVVVHLNSYHQASNNYGTLTQENVALVKKEGTFSTSDFRIQVDPDFKKDLIQAGVPVEALENLHL